jgi:hypothetical protein
MRLDAERRQKHLPGAGIEHFEETAVEHDAGRVALAPFDRQLPAESERCHASFPDFCDAPLITGRDTGVNADSVFLLSSRASERSE